ncbi:MAG: bacteriohemerythrin [Clostridiaceae bacterium]
MFEMDAQYFTGIKLVDDEHAKLFEIGRRGFDLLTNEYTIDKYDKIVAIIEELREYAIVHFRDEEEYMESIGYKRLFTQKMDHQAFIKKVSEVDFKTLDHDQEEALMDILTFVSKWLVEHILEKDMLIGK